MYDPTDPVGRLLFNVLEPRNIMWLCSAHPVTYRLCLAEAGVIDR